MTVNYDRAVLRPVFDHARNHDFETTNCTYSVKMSIADYRVVVIVYEFIEKFGQLLLPLEERS